MDLSCIILSGDLELYVLGMLPEEDAYKIEQLALLFPEVQTEINRITESLQGLTLAATAMPSPSVKENLMGKLKALKEEEQKEDTIGSIPLYKKEENNQPIEMHVVPASPVRKLKSSWLMAASVIGLVLSVGAVIFLSSQNAQKSNELASLRQRVDTLNKNVAAQEQEMLAYSQTMQMMQSPDYKKINLTSLPGKQDALARVFWDTKTTDVYISSISLPQAPSGKQYQLWAIVDGKPVDAGLITSISSYAIKMKAFARADAFAISIENAGGSPTPTEVFLMGKAS